MSYTAFARMREANRMRLGMDIGPMQPPVTWKREEGNSLKGAVLAFLRDSCEKLRFDPEKENEYLTETYTGTGIRDNQIPFNMQMDIDRLCLESRMDSFIASGAVTDAYSVYYCFLKMFFGGYGRLRRMVELLSEYESNGSSLLMKHRDHYTHSVYVFALGLAVYRSNPAFREAFRRFYGLEKKEGEIWTSEEHAAHLFLEFWGLTSLFHDIGYPLELPYEQAVSYFETTAGSRGAGKPYLAYRDVDVLTEIDGPVRQRLRDLYGREFRTVNELLAFDIHEKLGGTYGVEEEKLLDTLNSKPTHPEKFSYFMDHAWFSAVRLFREFCRVFGAESITEKHVDVLSAVVMHNSMYKFVIAGYKGRNPGEPLKMERHPLAFMLMLCDEMQVWDRTAYGRNTRRTLHPMDASFTFGEDSIRATYFYDEAEGEKIREFQEEYGRWERDGEKDGKPAPRLKDYSDMAEKEQRFTREIEKIVDTTSIRLTVVPGMKKIDREQKHLYLSSSSFLHLYDFAVVLNARFASSGSADKADTEKMEEDFERLSLEYQLYNISQAGHFDRFLDAIHCFYDDRPVDFDMLTAFTQEDVARIGPMEHERWIREHERMGWRDGRDYLDIPLSGGMTAEEGKKRRGDLREQARQHILMTPPGADSGQIRAHFFSLPAGEQAKDVSPFNTMLRLIRKYDGLRIYRLRGFGRE